MAKEKYTIRGMVADAIDKGAPLTERTIRGMREKNLQALRGYKTGFWVGIVIFNLLIWAPLPIGAGLAIPLAVLTLTLSLVVPIIGIRKHQASLALLEDSSSEPQRSLADGPGKVYIEQVRREGRKFIKAEMEALMGSKASAA